MTAQAEHQAWLPAPAAGPEVAAPLSAVDQWWASRDGDVLTVSARVVAREEELGGHFPGLPIYPGVYVIETLCQTMAIVGTKLLGARLAMSNLRSARFLAPLFGGDELTLAITAKLKNGTWDVTATGTRADGTRTAQLRADFQAAAEVADA